MRSEKKKKLNLFVVKTSASSTLHHGHVFSNHTYASGDSLISYTEKFCLFIELWLKSYLAKPEFTASC